MLNPFMILSKQAEVVLTHFRWKFTSETAWQYWLWGLMTSLIPSYLDLCVPNAVLWKMLSINVALTLLMYITSCSPHTQKMWSHWKRKTLSENCPVPHAVPWAARESSAAYQCLPLGWPLDWEGYVAALENNIKYFFAHDHLNYARLMPLHLSLIHISEPTRPY